MRVESGLFFLTAADEGCDEDGCKGGGSSPEVKGTRSMRKDHEPRFVCTGVGMQVPASQRVRGVGCRTPPGRKLLPQWGTVPEMLQLICKKT